MARIQEEVIVITVSKLHKNDEEDIAQIVNTNMITNLEVVVQELLGDGVVVEVNKA